MCGVVMRTAALQTKLIPIPTAGVAEYISELARKYAIGSARTSSDDLADMITLLSDDEVVSDTTEDIVVALKRARIIDGPTMVALLGNYLDEVRNVRSIRGL